VVASDGSAHERGEQWDSVNVPTALDRGAPGKTMAEKCCTTRQRSTQNA